MAIRAVRPHAQASSSAGGAPNPAASLSPYELRHLVAHMRAAGMFDEIHALLALDWPVMDDLGVVRRHNAWFELKEAADERAGFNVDVLTAWDAADAVAARPHEPGADRALGLGLRYALITASLGSIASNIPAELLVTLMSRGKSKPSRAIAVALQLGDPHELVAALAGLAGVFVDAGRSDDLLAAADELADPERARVLAAVADVATPPLLDKVLMASQALRDDGARSDVLVAVATRIDPAGVDRVIHAATGLGSDAARARVLVAAASVAPPDHLAMVSAASARLVAAHKREVYAVLAPRLPEADVAAALVTVERIGRSIETLRVASALARRLPEPARTAWLTKRRRAIKPLRSAQRAALYAAIGDGDAARDAAGKVRKHRDRALLMGGLGPYLGRDDLDALLPELTRWATSHQAARMVEGFVDNMPDDLLPRALEFVQSIYYSAPRARAIVALAPRLSRELSEAALPTALSVRDPASRASALAALAPRVGQDKLDEVLSQIGSARAPGTRPLLLASVAAHLSEPQMRSAFAMALRIGSAADRKGAIGALAPYLPDDLLDEAETGLEVINDVAAANAALASLAQVPEWVHAVGSFVSLAASALRLVKSLRQEPAATAGPTAPWSWDQGDREAATIDELATIAPELDELSAGDDARDQASSRPPVPPGPSELVAGLATATLEAAPELRDVDPGRLRTELITLGRRLLLRQQAELDEADRAFVQFWLGPLDQRREWAGWQPEELYDTYFPYGADEQRQRVGVAMVAVGLTSEADAVIKPIRIPAWRAQALARMVRIVPRSDRPALVDRIIAEWHVADGLRASVDRGGPVYERIGLAVIGDLGAVLQPPELQRLWRALSSIRNGWFQSRRSPGDIGYKSMCQAQAGLARSMDAAQRRVAVTQGLRILPLIGDHRIRELAAAALAGCVAPETLGAFTDAIHRLPPQRRADAYERLVARLCELGNGPEAFEVAAGIESPDPRRRAFEMVGRTLAHLPPDALARLWRPAEGRAGIVQRLAVKSRPMLLGDIQSLARVLAVVGGDDATQEAQRAIRDVTEWWP